MKPWIINLIYAAIEIILVSISLLIAKEAIICIINEDYTGYIQNIINMINYIRIISLIFILISTAFILFKPLRTKFTFVLSLINIITICIYYIFLL